MEARGSYDVVVIGAGPTGLACAIDAKRAGFRVCNIDKGCIVNSLYNYPTNMVFFTTPELLEIGNVPFPSANQKPTRLEALEYYRKVADYYELEVRQNESVLSVEGSDRNFELRTRDFLGRERAYRACKLVLATGYYDRPNYLRVPGEDLPKVEHYYREPHPYYNSDVVVVGAKNSAAIAALEIWRHGGRVTLVHRGPGMHAHVKYWIKPDIENRIKNDEIKAYFNSTIKEITAESVVIATAEGERRLANDFVLAMTGYHPDFTFMKGLGILCKEDDCPLVNTETLESNVPGIYLAGVIIAGRKTNEIFIENGRFHGAQIAADLKRKLQSREG